MSEPEDIDRNDEIGDIMGGNEGLDWMIDLLKQQTSTMNQTNKTITVMNELLSPPNVELMDEVLGAMLIYVDDYPELHGPDMTDEMREYIFDPAVTTKAEEIVQSLSDDKLRGILLGMTFMLQHETEGKNITLVACDIYHLIKTILYERTGLEQ
tara:strand:+ start:7707 stop:8168 length:462 start_codon:yes stop_codon:yes gene_type:complete